MNKFAFHVLLCIVCFLEHYKCDTQIGPDPWNYDAKELQYKIYKDANVPPDLKIIPKKGEISITGDWFYKRLLGIVLKGGQVKEGEYESIDVSLQMRLHRSQWETLEEYMKQTTTLSEDKLRRSLGLIEQAIYQPTITEKIAVAWSDYVHFYLIEYKNEITWTLGTLAAAGLLFWLWNKLSHRHLVMGIFLAIYLYEVLISYKEAEQKEVEVFMSAMNSCKWYIWTSSCEVPKPDPLIFLKHMNPLKIAIRMFTTLVTEPMILFSDTIKLMVHGVTDGLWFPFDKIAYAVLIVCLNVLLLFFLIMVTFNYILNIPFNLSFLGLVNVGLKRRHRRIIPEENARNQNRPLRIDNNNDVIGVATLDKILDVCSKALNTAQNNSTVLSNVYLNGSNKTKVSGLRRSASASRLADLVAFNNSHASDNVKKRNLLGGGDY